MTATATILRLAAVLLSTGPAWLTPQVNGQAGSQLWVNRFYAGYGRVNSIAADKSGNVFITGSTGNSPYNLATVAYSGGGIPLWTNIYPPFDGPGNSIFEGKAMAVEYNSGRVFVAGYSYTLSG